MLVCALRERLRGVKAARVVKTGWHAQGCASVSLTLSLSPIGHRKAGRRLASLPDDPAALRGGLGRGVLPLPSNGPCALLGMFANFAENGCSPP